MVDIRVNDLDFTKIRIIDANGTFTEYDMQEVLNINEHDLNNEIKLQPSKYVYWSSILEQIRGYLESAELAEEKLKAELYEVARDTLIAGGTPKPTKDQIDSWILRQEEYTNAKANTIAYRKFVKQLTFVVKSLEQRHSMLVQLSALKRDQMEYERSIRNL